MSEKRFVLCKKGDVEYIEDNCCVQLYGFDVLCEMLNEQQATITKLKELNDYKGKKIISLIRTNKTLKEKLYEDNKRLQTIIADLKEENEQLRQQHQRLYNYFRDYLEDEMSAENFGEMWDNVKEDERWNDE